MNSPFKAKPTSQHAPAASNPFAKALAEMEHGQSGDSKQPGAEANKLFSDALSKTGGSFPSLDNAFSGKDGNSFDPNALRKQQEEAEKQAKKQRMRLERHREINQLDMHDVYSAQEERVKREIEKTRHELKLLAQEIAQLQRDVDIAVTQPVVNPGQDGKYYISFFQQLRRFIMMLRQRIKSARTWAQQMHQKKKKRKMRGAGIMVDGGAAEQSKAVHDMMHHEQNTAYSGG